MLQSPTPSPAPYSFSGSLHCPGTNHPVKPCSPLQFCLSDFAPLSSGSSLCSPSTQLHSPQLSYPGPAHPPPVPTPPRAPSPCTPPFCPRSALLAPQAPILLQCHPHHPPGPHTVLSPSLLAQPHHPPAPTLTLYQHPKPSCSISRPPPCLGATPDPLFPRAPILHQHNPPGPPLCQVSSIRPGPWHSPVPASLSPRPQLGPAAPVPAPVRPAPAVPTRRLRPRT